MLLDAVAKAFQDGGEFMYFITMTSGFAMAIIIERVYYLMVRYPVDTGRIVEQVTNGLKSRQVNQADVDEITAKVKSPIGELGLSIVSRADKPARYIRDRAFETYLRVRPEVQLRTSYLSMLANVATLLGLLGTILGLIQAFEGVAAADPANKQALLASGIAVAMNTTAYGLMVAIPCIVSHSILSSRMLAILGGVETVRQRASTLLDQAE